MAEEKEDETKPGPVKPVRRVKRVLQAEAPAAEPKGEEAPKAAPKAAPRAAPKPAAKETPKARAPSKSPAAKKPAAKPAGEVKAPPAKVEEKKPEAETPAVKKEPAAEKKRPAKETPKKKPEEKPAKKGEKKEKGKAKEDEEEEEEEHEARKKPELTDAIRAALRIRLGIARRRPTFYRQEWFRHPRLGMKWRKPQGGQSKLRRHLGYRINVVSIGFRGPKSARGLHPSGFQEVLVHTVNELKGLDPKRQAVRIGGGVGDRKRQQIQEEADDLGLRVLNPRVE